MASTERQERLEYDVDFELTELEEALNMLISITPTGAKRDAYTEVNIHRMAALEALKKAQAL